ncbi:cytochrome P450 [Amycolatopsis sp. NPDC023774]|uniref:cytochrome P450 n=1 Tax=Amycolatopsis sp. NPDC023774 TaxID=3155015 RepID=UPI0033F01AB8
MRNLEFGDTAIPAGDAVVLALASTHRDRTVFEDPDAFDADRPDNPHLTVDHGPISASAHPWPASSWSSASTPCCAATRRRSRCGARRSAAAGRPPGR